MHRIFGEKTEQEYYTRAGAYLVPVENGKVAVTKTPKGYFLLGGGYEGQETDAECIKRECIEESGFEVEIYHKICSAETYTMHHKVGPFHPVQVYYIGRLIRQIAPPMETDHQLVWMHFEEIKGKMFSQMQNWALEVAFEKNK